MLPSHFATPRKEPKPTGKMDDFDIEMGDAVDVPMEEPEAIEIPLGDDPQV